MNAPSTETDDPERERECLTALAETFKDLTATAAEAGWTREEIAFGLLELSRHEVRSLMKLKDRPSTPSEAAAGTGR